MIFIFQIFMDLSGAWITSKKRAPVYFKIAQREFENLIFEKYINAELISNDESKTEGKCGCAFYHEPECETSLWLLAEATIFAAEAYAITIAHRHLSVKHQQGNFVICTDTPKINTHTEKSHQDNIDESSKK
jgi:hypothetical protein